MTRILLFLFAFLSAAPASAAVELAFYSHEMSMSGKTIVEFPHAFITVRGTPDAGGRAINRDYGFSAAKISPAILLGPVKGTIFNHGRKYIAASRRHMAVRLSDARYAAVQAAFKRWAAVKGASYDLEKRNCVHFIAAMAVAAGLSVPNDPKLWKEPAMFLDAMARRNAT